MAPWNELYHIDLKGMAGLLMNILLSLLLLDLYHQIKSVLMKLNEQRKNMLVLWMPIVHLEKNYMKKSD